MTAMGIGTPEAASQLIVPAIFVLMGIRLHVIPQTIAVSGAHEAFNDDGSLKNEKMDATCLGVGEALVGNARLAQGPFQYPAYRAVVVCNPDFRVPRHILCPLVSKS